MGSAFRIVVLAGVVSIACVACNSGTSPVAPEGTILTIEANPSSIPVTGTSAITVSARDMATGVPIRSGTEIRLTTTLGTIESVVKTDGDGFARATLRADGREGMAEVFARSGLADQSGSTLNEAKTMVKIGSGTSAKLEAKFEPVVGESLTVFFDDQSTGDPTSWEWQFGDGARSFEREPTHTYGAAGTYVVTLTVRDPEGDDSLSRQVTVPASQGAVPDAVFDEKIDGLRVTFEDKSTNRPTSWQWDFGDGATSGVQHPVHTYAAAGNYTVRLTVANAAGSDSASKILQVPQTSPPEAKFEFRETDNLTVLFRDDSTNNPTRWSWDFGDGGRSSEQNPEHRYAATGVYTVTLEVANVAGSSTDTQFVEVFGPLVANFTFTQNGLQVVFTDRSLGGPQSYEWNFGDGTSVVTDTNPVHTYQSAGTYAVTLKVKRTLPGHQQADESTATKTVKVP